MGIEYVFHAWKRELTLPQDSIAERNIIHIYYHNLELHLLNSNKLKVKPQSSEIIDDAPSIVIIKLLLLRNCIGSSSYLILQSSCCGPIFEQGISWALVVVGSSIVVVIYPSFLLLYFVCWKCS